MTHDRPGRAWPSELARLKARGRRRRRARRRARGRLRLGAGARRRDPRQARRRRRGGRPLAVDARPVRRAAHRPLRDRARPDAEVVRGAATTVHFADDQRRRDRRVRRDRRAARRSPGRSPSTGSAARSCAASRATTTTSSGSACRCCGRCSRSSAMAWTDLWETGPADVGSVRGAPRPVRDVGRGPCHADHQRGDQVRVQLGPHHRAQPQVPDLAGARLGRLHHDPRPGAVDRG